jgi:hypothetical protein
MTNTFNKLACLKEIGSIEHRLSDTTLSPVLRRDIIQRHVTNLICDLIYVGNESAKFGGILERLANRHTSDTEILAGCALLRSLIPMTIGLCPAGTSVWLAGGVLVTKRKEGVELGNGRMLEHPAPDTPVTVINA